MILKILDKAVNCVTVQVECEDARGMRIYRADRADGVFEEVGICQRGSVCGCGGFDTG